MATSNQETSFLYGLNETYIAELYKRYLDSPDSVDASWSDFFERLNEDEQAILDAMRGASWAPRQTSVVGGNGDAPSLSDVTDGIRQAPPSQIQLGGRASSEQIRQATLDSIRAIMLIRAYRMRGHLLADLDPLKLNKPLPHPELDPQSYGFTERDKIGRAHV